MRRNPYSLAVIEFQIDVLMKAAGITYDPFGDILPEVTQALLRGQRGEAIMLLRNKTGFGIVECDAELKKLAARLKL